MNTAEAEPVYSLLSLYGAPWGWEATKSLRFPLLGFRRYAKVSLHKYWMCETVVMGTVVGGDPTGLCGAGGDPQRMFPGGEMTHEL